MNGLTLIAVALGEIALVGVIALAFTTWPLWRRYKNLKKEHDEKAREILASWQPHSGRKPS
jgi:hypothetical protein